MLILGPTFKHYLSVNAATLETAHEGMDLRKWHEQGQIFMLILEIKTKR
jgi:hypothetical protein